MINYCDGVDWLPWCKKFAWLPVYVNNHRIWFDFYYVRYGRSRFSYVAMRRQSVKQLGTILDVLK